MVRFAMLLITGTICTSLLPFVLCTGYPYLMLTEGPADEVYVEGSGRNVATFNCSTVGRPEPQITWTRNDIQIQENDKYRITDGGALVVSNPDRDDHGDRFRCGARNAFGALRSREVTLEIAYMDDPRKTRTDTTVPWGSGSCLSCNSPDAYPGIRAQWSKEDVSIDANNRKMILSDGRLCFSNVMSADAGGYACSVTNSYAIDQGDVRLAILGSVNVNLLIARPGEGNQQLQAVANVPTNVTVKRGEEAILQCIFLGKPLPNLLWTTDRPLDAGVSTGNYQLRIPDAQPHHSGEYTCTATLGDESGRTTQYLTVESPPILTAELSDIEKGALSSVEFRCESNDPSDVYSWYYNAEPIQFNNRIERTADNAIFIASALVSDSGIYQCSVTNRFGEVFSTAQLAIRAPRVTTVTPTTDYVQTLRPSAIAPTTNVETTTQEETGPGYEYTEPHDERTQGPGTGNDEPPKGKQGGNSSVMLTGSAMLLLVVLIWQKTL